MPRSSKQKTKLLCLLKILREETDEDHYLGSPALIERLAEYGINAERKSIYDDIAQLTDFGYDIVHAKSASGGGYYLAGREFELPELKLMVDVVQASRFITQKKSRELIHKLEQFASQYDAGQLQRQVYVSGRVKTDNENIYYNVDFIHRAIQEDVQISFQYLEWTLSGKLSPRKNGMTYRISPWALSWNDENYYMIGFDDNSSLIKHYRVDKMGNIALTGIKRQGDSQFRNFDIASYVNKTFGMYGGREETVTLQFNNRLIGIAFDRFGRDIKVRRVDDDISVVWVTVAVSGQFFGWLSGLSEGVRLTGPKTVVEEYKEYLHKLLYRYEDRGGRADEREICNQDEGL